MRILARSRIFGELPDLCRVRLRLSPWKRACYVGRRGGLDGPLVRFVGTSGDVGTVAGLLAPYGIFEADLQLGVAERLGNDVIGSS